MTDILKDFKEINMLPNLRDSEMPLFLHRMCEFINKNAVVDYSIKLNYANLLENTLFVQECENNSAFAFEVMKALEANTSRIINQKRWSITDEAKVKNSKEELYKFLCKNINFNDFNVLTYFIDEKKETLFRMYKKLKNMNESFHDKERCLFEYLYQEVTPNRENLSHLISLINFNKDLSSHLNFKDTVSYFKRYEKDEKNPTLHLEDLLKILSKTVLTFSDIKNCTQEEVNTVLSLSALYNDSQKYYIDRFINALVSHNSLKNKMVQHFIENFYDKVLNYHPTNILRNQDFIHYCQTHKKAENTLNKIFNKEVYCTEIINFLERVKLSDLLINEETLEIMTKAKYKIASYDIDLKKVYTKTQKNRTLNNKIFEDNINYLHTIQENLALKKLILQDKNKEAKPKGFKL